MTNHISIIDNNNEINNNTTNKWSRKIGFGLLTFFGMLVGFYGLAMPILTPIFAQGSVVHANFLLQSQTLLYFHFIGAGIALLISPIQFYLYKRFKTAHRIMGRIYGLSVLFGAIGALNMAQTAYGGLISTWGLSILAILWIVFTGMAIYFAIKRDIKAHKRWIIRSVALTFAALTLRVISPFIGLVVDDMTTSQIVYWLSWIINLLLAEIWIVKKKL
ncbi:MAG: DUF2306 domain-containing protein [Saccharospirillaceae bacterium]|nr:DUF2306 domain-containing protein [Pseudomonadales bacterium]NRB77110.1 DUF2306 domain-containing protein [Saccharospirillaceae bacterium]